MTTQQEKDLQKEYYELLAEFDKGNRRMKRVKKRMVEITKLIVVKELIVEPRPDELELKRK